MKTYQDPDILHGNSKATPKPRRDTTHSSRKPWNTFKPGTKNKWCCVSGHGK